MKKGFSGKVSISIQKVVFEQITILAPGLLGASLGMAAREYALGRRVHVWARRAESRQACLDADWCNEAFSSPVDAVKESDLVIVCTPVDRIAELVKEIGPALSSGCLVTDVGSTKSRICRISARSVPEGVVFIGSHPMAGSEKSGMEHARAGIFKQRACLVTPVEDSPEDCIDRVVRFWRALDMEVATMSPEQHDEIVAHISHFPHLLASLLCIQLSRKPDPWQAFSGNGLRDTTRIAAGSPEIWRSIFEENKEELLRAIEGFEQELSTMRSHLHNDEWSQVRHLLARGRKYREGLL